MPIWVPESESPGPSSPMDTIDENLHSPNKFMYHQIFDLCTNWDPCTAMQIPAYNEKLQIFPTEEIMPQPTSDFELSHTKVSLSTQNCVCFSPLISMIESLGHTFHSLALSLNWSQLAKIQASMKMIGQTCQGLECELLVTSMGLPKCRLDSR